MVHNVPFVVEFTWKGLIVRYCGCGAYPFGSAAEARHFADTRNV